MYIAGAFPSACGKTNLAMLKSPLEDEGWRVRTVGEDIAWLHVGDDGRCGRLILRPAIWRRTGHQQQDESQRDGERLPRHHFYERSSHPGWGRLVGRHGRASARGTDHWQSANGLPTSYSGRPSQCPLHGPRDQQSGSVFALGRRPGSSHFCDFVRRPSSAHNSPGLQSFDWQHGVYMGATMASETTAAATGQVGVVRRDPMAMLPFCGYNMGDYRFGHWLEMGRNAIPSRHVPGQLVPPRR